MNATVLLVFKVMGIISLILVLLFLFFLAKLNILPIFYLLLVVGVFLFLDLFSLLAIFKFKTPWKFLAIFFVVVLTGTSFLGCYYTYHTDTFLNRSFRSNKLSYSTNYYVVTSVDSTIESFNQLTGVVSYYSGSGQAEEALGHLQSERKNDISYQAYDDVVTMFQSVLAANSSAMLVEQTSYELVFQVDRSLVKEQYRIIYEFEIYTEEDSVSNENRDVFNLYIGGNDFTNSLIDFNMIMTVNLKSHLILLTSIPRDYYIPVAGQNGMRDTLSFMGSRGLEQNRQSLSEFLGFDLNYYMKINTKSLVGIVDEVGGITYCSDMSYTTTHATILDSYDDSKGSKLNIQKGCQHLNGIEALTVARERKAFLDGDRQRQKNCQAIILAIFQELKSMKTITNYNNVLNSLSDLYQTNIPREVITDLIRETIDGAEWHFEQQSLNGSDGQGNVYLSNLVSYVMIPNMNSVNAAQAKIQEVLEGK